MAAIWDHVRDRLDLDAGPLDRSVQPDAYIAEHAPVLMQICGPMAARSGRVAVLGAFDFALPGLAPGDYASHIVRRTGDAGPIGLVAVNDFQSQSGWGALAAAGLGDRTVVVTGAHTASMRAVAAGEADAAAIDAVTWRLDPHPRLRVRTTTPPTPAPPLVTCHPERADALRAALAEAVASLSVAIRRRTGLRAFVPRGDAHYAGMTLPPPPAAAQDRCNRAESAA